MIPQQITEKNVTAEKTLKYKYPGEIENIRLLEIKTPLGTSFPIYVSSNKYK